MPSSAPHELELDNKEVQPEQIHNEIKEFDLPQAVSEGSDILYEDATAKEQYATSPSKTMEKK